MCSARLLLLLLLVLYVTLAVPIEYIYIIYKRSRLNCIFCLYICWCCSYTALKVLTPSESTWRWRFIYERKISKVIVSLGLAVTDVVYIRTGVVFNAKATNRIFFFAHKENYFSFIWMFWRARKKYGTLSDTQAHRQKRYNRKIDYSIIYTLSEIPHSLVIDTWKEQFGASYWLTHCKQ